MILRLTGFFFFFVFLNASNCYARGGLAAGRADRLERAWDVPEPANADDAIGLASEGVGHTLTYQGWGHVLQRSNGMRKMLHSGAPRMASPFRLGKSFFFRVLEQHGLQKEVCFGFFRSDISNNTLTAVSSIRVTRKRKDNDAKMIQYVIFAKGLLPSTQCLLSSVLFPLRKLSQLSLLLLFQLEWAFMGIFLVILQ